MEKPQTVEDCLHVLLDMIEEVQVEARHCLHADDYRYLVAKRDTLTELKFRIRDGKVDSLWARRVIAMPL